MNLRLYPFTHFNLAILFVTISIAVFSVVIWSPTLAHAQVQFPLIGTTNTSFATGSPKDRHMVFFDNIMVDGYLENYNAAANAFAGQLKFRKSLDGYTWTEALSNPTVYPIFASRNFHVIRSMTGGTACTPESDCNIYIVYFDSAGYWTTCGGMIPNSPLGNGGDVWFVELSYKQATSLWEMQAPVKVTDNTKSFVSLGKQIFYDTYSSVTTTHPGSVSGCAGVLSIANPVAEPKPQVWVEGNNAWVLYDLRISDEHWLTTNNGSDYQYLRVKRFTKSGSTWSYVANSERDVGYFQNCITYEQWSSSGAFAEDGAEGFSFEPSGNSTYAANNPLYAAFVRNSADGKFYIVFNVQKLTGNCGFPSQSSYEPLWPATGQVYQRTLSYLAINDDNFSCGHIPGSGTAPSCTLGDLDTIASVYPGKYFSVATTQDDPATSSVNEAWLRTVYPQNDVVGGGVIKIRQTQMKNTTTKSSLWMSEFSNHDAFSPVITGEGSRYWVISERDPLGAPTDIDVRYRKYDASNLPVYPVDSGGLPIEGQINVSGTNDKNPTAPLSVPLWGSTYLTSLGHPATAWVNNKASVFFPEGVEDGIRISGWGWASTIGWISLDYLNIGHLGDRRYGMFVCQKNTASICPNSGTTTGLVVHGQMWSSNVGWVTLDYNPATQCGGVGKAKSSWTPNGVRVNATASTDPNVSFINKTAAVAEGAPGNGFEVVWQRDDSANGTNIYMQRLSNTTGASTMGADKAIVNAAGTQSDPQIVYTNDGNFIIAWSDNRNGNYDIYAHKVNINGNAIAGWVANGNQVSDAGQSAHQMKPQLVADTAGGAYIIWSDERGGVGAADIYIQRMTSAGARAWANDVVVASQPNKQDQYKLALTGTSAFVVWTDCRATDLPGACPGGSALADIYYQLVTSVGTTQYAANGLLLTDDVGGNKTHGYSPFVVNSATNAIVLHGRRGYTEKNLHRIETTTGNVLWDKEVNTLSEYTLENYTDAMQDGSGGMVFTWYQPNVTANASNEVLVRLVDQNGNLSWDNAGGRGLLLTDNGGESVSPRLSSDLGGGSVRVTWLDSRSGSYQVYVQQVTGGAINWDTSGFQVTNLSAPTQMGNLLTIRGPANGNGIVIWTDEREGYTGDGRNNDVYTQLIETATPISCSSGPPEAISPALPAAILARYEPDNNKLEGWARIISLKDEGERIDGSFTDGTVDVDCNPSDPVVSACNWGWLRFSGTWSNTTSTNLRVAVSIGQTLTEVISTAGFPISSSLLLEPGANQETISYAGKDATNPPSFALTTGATKNHDISSAVRLAMQSGSYSVGAQYMGEKGTYQLFDFGYSPHIGWVEFRPFRFVGFPFVEVRAGDVYSGNDVQLPAPPAGLLDVDTGWPVYTATYLIQANGDVVPTITYGQRSAPGASSQGGDDPGTEGTGTPIGGSTGLTRSATGQFGFPDETSQYANALGKMDVSKLTTVIDDPSSVQDCTRPNGVLADCGNIDGAGHGINDDTCYGELWTQTADPMTWHICTNDGSGINIFGSEVVVRHTPHSRFESYNGAVHPLFVNESFNLGGKVYYYPNSTPQILARNHYVTNSAVGVRGSGVIVTNGADIRKNITYHPSDPISPSTIKQLASPLWIVKNNLNIDAAVTELAGSFLVGVDGTGIVQTCIQNGTTPCEQNQLIIRGLVIAKEFVFGRTFVGDDPQVISESSEQVINDGRLLLNPPLGLEDLSKTIPDFDQVRP